MFTLIADSTGPIGNFGTVPSPTLNEAGRVAFNATLDNNTRGIFTGSGGLVTTIALYSFPVGGFGIPSINDMGTVAVFEKTQGISEGERIISGNGGLLTVIADTAGPFKGFSGQHSTAINAAGVVAFWALPDTGPAGIFASDGGAVTPLFLNTTSLAANTNLAFNDAGTLAFRKANATGIVTVNSGSITTIVDSLGQLNYFGAAPSLSATGTVAFVAGTNGIDGGVFGIYSGNGGQPTTIADLSGPFNYVGDFNFNQPSINDTGAVAFMAGLDAGGGGIFIGNGTTTNQVLDATAPLFGSTLTGLSISPTSHNDSGQVAFYYELANGTKGIAIANPVPEPSPSLLLALSLGLSLARRIRQKC